MDDGSTLSEAPAAVVSRENGSAASRPLKAWLVTWVAYATYYAGRKGFSVAKKSIETDLGISRADLGAIDTAYLSAYAVGLFASGVLADRVGARRLVGYGLLASAAACAAFGAMRTALGLAVVFFASGLAQSTGWPGTTRSVAEWTTTENRRRVMALWCTCYQFGGIAATAFAAWLLRFGWRSAFFAPAVVMALVGALVLFTLAPGPNAPEAASTGPTTPAENAARADAIRAALRSPTLYLYGASYFSIKLIRYSLLFWLPYYLSDSFSYSSSTAGYVSMAFELGGLAGVVGMGLVTHRFPNVSRPAFSCVTLLGLAAALFFYVRLASLGPSANVLGLALIGASLYGPDSLISGAVAQDAGGPHAAATATGIVNGVGSLGAILQGALNAWVSRVFGWRAVFFLFVGFAVASALFLVPTFAKDRSVE